MSQSAVILPGSPLTGAALCADINLAFAAIISKFSGTTAPTAGPGASSALVAGQSWLNTTAAIFNVLNIYDGTSFLPFLNVDITNHKVGALFSSWVGTSPPVTKTGASGSQGVNDSSLIINNAGTFTLTLIAPAAGNAGQWLYVRTITANTVVSASSNVVPLAGGAAGTAILAATAGKWAALQSDGTSWQIMAGN